MMEIFSATEKEVILSDPIMDKVTTPLTTEIQQQVDNKSSLDLNNEKAKNSETNPVTPAEQQQPGDSKGSFRSKQKAKRVFNKVADKTANNRKRRRGKTKRNNNNNRGRQQHQQLSSGGNKKSVNWKHPLTKTRAMMRSLVPYNTNKFLMEDHLPELQNNNRGRTRESSFSVDSDENYFYSLPEDEEEFLTKEFATVYESAKCERLDGLTKPQLIEEYLQLETNYDLLSKQLKLDVLKMKSEQETNGSLSPENQIQALQEQVLKLTSDNYDLKNQLEFFRRKSSLAGSARTSRRCSTEALSEDSESDSSTSTSSSSSSSCSDSSNCSKCSFKMNGEENRVIPNGFTVDDEDIPMNDTVEAVKENGLAMEEAEFHHQSTRKPPNPHQRHRTHRQRRNSKIHQQQQAIANRFAETLDVPGPANPSPT